MVTYLREVSRSVCFVVLCLLPKTAAFSVPERIAWVNKQSQISED